MKTIKKEIEIAAPKESVWAVLMEDSYQRAWLSIFSPGTHAETDWIVGHKVKFTDDSKMGVFGTVEEKLPYEKLSLLYDGMILNGEESRESAESEAVKGTREIYILSEKDGNTLLQISSEMNDEMYQQMSDLWDLALKKIDGLSHAI